MARAIIRWSMDGERSNATGNTVRKAMEARGAERIGTGAYEIEINLDETLDAMIEAMMILRDAPGGGWVDHLWIYVDRTDPM